MKIWVDADAIPRVIKEIILRSAEKRQVQCTLVANSYQRLPPSPYIHMEVVAKGHDVADEHIVQFAALGDLVITQDIPLAYELTKKGITTIGPRGQEFTAANIADRLSTRDLLDELRSSGMARGGPPPISDKEKHQFASVFDRILTKLIAAKK